MSLGRGTINPLNVIGQRRISYIPHHFGVMVLPDTKVFDKIDLWIFNNLTSRYCMLIRQGLNDQRKIIDVCEIGIEDKKELTMLSLACPYLH